MTSFSYRPAPPPGDLDDEPLRSLEERDLVLKTIDALARMINEDLVQLNLALEQVGSSTMQG